MTDLHDRDILVTVEGVDFSYGSLQVLFSVDLTIRRGEMLALLGTNGAGKSTLLRVLCGLSSPTSGRIEFDGVDVTTAGVVDMVEAGVGLLPGGRAVFPDLTVSENLEIGSYRLRRSRLAVQQRIDTALELFPALTPRLSTAAGSLSGGEQQQLALAKAFLLEPRLLCIDELSLGLAPVVVEQLIEVVIGLNRAGTTVLLVEQSLNIAAELCPRAVFMEKGTVRFEGPTSELLDRGDLARAVFLGGGTR